MTRQQKRAAERRERKRDRKRKPAPLAAAPANELVWSPGAREALGLDVPKAGIGPARAVARAAHDIAHELFHSYAENDQAFAEDCEDLSLDECPACGVALLLHEPAPNGALFGFEHPEPVCAQQVKMLDALNVELLELSRQFDVACDEEEHEIESRGVA